MDSLYHFFHYTEIHKEDDTFNRSIPFVFQRFMKWQLDCFFKMLYNLHFNISLEQQFTDTQIMT